MDNVKFRKENYYYKYRSLESLERVLEILVDKNLYGALYNEMNDPMEGYYKYDYQFPKDFLKPIVEGKQRTYICSLSRSGDIGLMWTHYANQNRGCCLVVEVTAKKWRKVDVVYSDEMPTLEAGMTAEDVLSVKAKMWGYEEETRFLCEARKKNERPMLTVKIKQVLLGYNIDRKQASVLKKVINKIDGEIEVVQMKKSDLSYGYR